MAVIISGNGIDMGNNPVSNASKIDGVVINENNENVATTSSLVGFKNYIINGNFDIWQRGTSFTGLTNGTYSSDRWVVYDATNNINYNVIRNAGVFNTGYGATYSFNSGTGERSVIQFIENVTRFKVGSNVTISFEAYTNSTPYTVAVTLQGVKGVWASRTGEVTPSNIALTNIKTKYSVTLPISDWTSLGIDWAHLEDTKLALKFNLGVETNGRDFILGNVQLEKGSVATPFEQRPIELELSLCQRYYEYSGGNHHWATMDQPGASSSMYKFNPIIKYSVTKRVVPTLVLTEHNGFAGVQIIGQTTTGFDFRNVNTNVTGYNDKYFRWTADAEL